MQAIVLRSFKWALTVLGARVPDRILHHLTMALNYLRLGRWMSTHGFRFPRVARRELVFDAVAREIADRRVAYLEFGVFQGESTRYWARALRHPEATLHGFDSFEGLPEDLDDAGGGLRKGRFATGRQAPVIDDPRVSFFKGWFEDTLRGYVPPEHDVLFIMIDADLYSSTICVLRHLRPWIRRGTYVYFDDLSRPDHELRAFEQFMRESGLRFRPFVADAALNRACLVCEGVASGSETAAAAPAPAERAR
jgi:hypothetical protein